MVLGQEHGPGEARDVGVWLGTLEPASYGHPRCRVRATCVLDLGHCERPGGRWGNSTVPGCGASLRGVRDNPADRIMEEKKSFCCVTTRRRNLWGFNGLGSSLGLLTALTLGLGVAGFDLGGLAMFGLPSSSLPAADLPLAFRLLAIALVPTPRLVLSAAAFAQAFPRAGPPPSGRRIVFSLTVENTHGRFALPRESSGRMSHHPPRALSKRELNDCM